jgi:L-ascorbate metabolism protein UlaG (beta-lactamase superfamily)
VIAFSPVLLEPQPGQVAIRWLGQGGFAFRSPNGITWVVDPYLSDFGRNGAAERLVPPPVDPSTVFCDAVLCTHAHSDHADPVSLGAIAKASPDARFLGRSASMAVGVEAGIAERRLQTLSVGDRGVPVRGMRQSSTDVHVDVVFADHSGDACGFVFAVGDGARPFRVYVTGDTLHHADLASEVTLGADLLCVCINGRWGNMSAEEAAMLAHRLDARRVIPMHYGVMVNNDADPATFISALASSGATAEPKVLAIGESWLVSY